MGVALPAAGVRDERRQVPFHRLVRRVAGGSQKRFVDDAEADLTGQVGDDGMAALGRRDQGVEGLTPAVVDRAVSWPLLQPAFEDVDDDRDLGADPLLRLVDPVQRLLQCRSPLEVVDAVVAEGAAKGHEERRRQSLSLDVERTEVRLQVLSRGAHLKVGFGLVARTRNKTRRSAKAPSNVVLGSVEVRIRAEARHAVASSAAVALASAASRSYPSTIPCKSERSCRHRARASPPSPSAAGTVTRAAGCSASGSGPVASSCTKAAPASTCSLRPASTCRTRPPNGAGTAVSIFMLSMTATGVADSDLVAGHDGQGDDHARSRGANNALVVSAEPVRCAVDLDEMLAALHGRDDPRRSCPSLRRRSNGPSGSSRITVIAPSSATS